MKKLFDIDINFKENKLSTIFTDSDSIRTIVSWFSDPSNEFDIEKYKLSDIVEYCGISGKLTELNSLFTEEFKEKMKKGYIPSSQTVITDFDIKQIVALTGFSIEKVKKMHISIGEMASPLKHLFKDIKRATLPNINKIQNNTIKKILEKALNNSVNDQDAKDFYKEITEIEEEPTGDKVSKLKNFISSNQDILTYIFKKADGLERLKAVIYSIGDGCGANIANNLNNMAISFLLDDKKGKIKKNKYIALKLIYESLITDGILQQALGDGDYLGGTSNASLIRDYNEKDPKNILNNRFISPDRLIEIISKQSSYAKHSDIIPKEIGKRIRESEDDYLSKEKQLKEVIAIKALNLLIKGDTNQNKITNDNSVIYGDVVSKNKAPSSRIMPLLFKKLLSRILCCKK